ATEQLLVFLDNHVSDGTWCCSDVDQNGLWYNSRWPVRDWLEAGSGVGFVDAFL
ncbi:unnamed protein product, partial [Symbiodinium pilosum]